MGEECFTEEEDEEAGEVGKERGAGEVIWKVPSV